MVIKSFLHRILSLPICYDLMQLFFGLNKKKKILRRLIKFKEGARVVLDVGGGTGLYKDLWPPNYRYACLDVDLVKLAGFSQKYPNDFKICCNATQMGLISESVDYVFCSSMSHHIHEDMLNDIFSEMYRTLRDNGVLVFLDAVRIPENRLNQFLWNLDRGEYPHSYDEIQNMIGKHFKIQTVQKFSIYYDYILIIANKI